MKEINAKEANDLMQGNPEVIYLDVRSVAEFEQGHPPNALNIPLMHFSPGVGMYPNENFEKVVGANLQKEAQVLIGCKTGGRSAKACEIMTAMGYKNLTNIRGGFVGVMDPTGRITEPGWSLLNLPLCQDCKEESHYEALSSINPRE